MARVAKGILFKQQGTCYVIGAFRPGENSLNSSLSGMTPHTKRDWLTGWPRWREKPQVGVSWSQNVTSVPRLRASSTDLTSRLTQRAHRIAPWSEHGVRYPMRGRGDEGHGSQERGNAETRLSPGRSREAPQVDRKLHSCLPGSRILQTSFLQNYLGFMYAWL